MSGWASGFLRRDLFPQGWSFFGWHSGPQASACLEPCFLLWWPICESFPFLLLFPCFSDLAQVRAFCLNLSPLISALPLALL